MVLHEVVVGHVPIAHAETVQHHKAPVLIVRDTELCPLLGCDEKLFTQSVPFRCPWQAVKASGHEVDIATRHNMPSASLSTFVTRTTTVLVDDSTSVTHPATVLSDHYTKERKRGWGTALRPSPVLPAVQF